MVLYKMQLKIGISVGVLWERMNDQSCLAIKKKDCRSRSGLFLQREEGEEEEWEEEAGRVLPLLLRARELVCSIGGIAGKPFQQYEMFPQR